MRARQSVFIERPVSEVFTFIADPANDHTWRSELVSSAVVGEVREGVGMHTRQTIAYQGRTGEVNLEVTEFVPDERICLRAHGGVRAHGCFDLAAEGDGTRLAVSATVELKGAASMLERYVRQAIEQAASEDLLRLKAVLEAEG